MNKLHVAAGGGENMKIKVMGAWRMERTQVAALALHAMVMGCHRGDAEVEMNGCLGSGVGLRWRWCGRVGGCALERKKKMREWRRL